MDVLCIQDVGLWDNVSVPFKPPERRACQVSCPRDCVLGEWENWSACTQSCGTSGIRIRTRPIAQEVTAGGTPCNTGERYDEKPCDNMPCSWWHTGQWSGCSRQFVGDRSCGLARQVRTVYCLNALDEVLDDQECVRTAGSKPISSQDCWVPCPGECLVSDWSEWGECSATCGVQGGTQTRTRQIVDRGSPDTPCPVASDLVQSRICNQRACKLPLWQVHAWGECLPTENATESGLCGEEGTGTQTRDLVCQLDPGYPINASYCAVTPRPDTTRPCVAPCPQDCKLSAWGDWSICSEGCTHKSTKYKYRVVLRWAMYGGRSCPGNPDNNGIIVKRKPCNKKHASCGASRWVASDWATCEVKGQDDCGKGVQKRNVSCVKDDKEVNNGICYEDGLGAPPVVERSCHVVCVGDCRLSAWSAYTPCSQSCGVTPGVRTRTRYIINWDPSRSVDAQCPQLKDVLTLDSAPCQTEPCPTYQWVTSPWQSCIPHGDEDNPELSCGPGSQTRHVLCRHDNGSYVPDHRCDIVSSMPRRQKACHVSCPVDCQVSSWSNWSNCSQVCGDGLRHRERHITQSPSHGGRHCPSLQDVTTCFIRECKDFDWQISTWGKCEPNWGMHCGSGTQLRSVVCPAGQQYEHICMERKVKPQTQTECYKPCLGDCVMSEWSEFSPCDCNTDSPRRTRSRQIIQEALSSAVQCGDTLQTQPCHCPNYQLIIGGWTNCQLYKPTNHRGECGKGIEKRPINCIHGDSGVIVHLSNCILGNLTLSQSCEVPCAEDCAVSEYTLWSPCSAECGADAMKTRSAVIVKHGNKLGRECPSTEQLHQYQVCNSAPCYNYSFVRGPWGGCRGQRPGHCGVSRETRDIMCHRSDGVVVQDLYCLLHENLELTSLDDLTQREAADLDLDTERSCGEPCPGDCIVTEWSEFGPCIQNCSHGSVSGYQTRSRAIIRPALGGSPCPWDIIQTRLCPSEVAVCPVFVWETGKWNERNKRKVQCELNGLAVSGGCIVEDQPSRHADCPELCGEFAECIEGRCQCEPGYAGDGAQCLPEFGCATDAHCFLNNTYCDLMNKECLCWDETLPGTDLLCTSKSASATEEDPLEELNQLFIYILIGCLIALLFLGIVTVVCMVSHRRRRQRKNAGVESNKLTKIDNLDTTPKNNDLRKVEPVYVAKLAGDNDKNVVRSWQNSSPYGQMYSANLTRASSDNDTGRGDSTVNSSPAFSQTDRKLDNLADLDDDLFTDDDMARQPFLSERREPYNTLPRGASRSASPDVVLRVPSSRSIHSSSDTGSRLSTFRPDDSTTPSSPSMRSEVTAIWVPQNDLGASHNAAPSTSKFPVAADAHNIGKSDGEDDGHPRYDRNLTRTPPTMYENLAPPENIQPQSLSTPAQPQTTPAQPQSAPILPPRNSPRGAPPPIAPKPSPEIIQNAAAGRPVSRRHNTEPVPSHFRNGMVFPRGDTVGPTQNTLEPQQGLSESNSAKDLKDLRGRGGAPGTSAAQTEDLMRYCDELLADLQRVANS